MLSHLSSPDSVITFGAAPQRQGNEAATEPAGRAVAVVAETQQVPPAASASPTAAASTSAAQSSDASAPQELAPHLEGSTTALPKSTATFNYDFDAYVHVLLHRFVALPDADYPDILEVTVTKDDVFAGGEVRERHTVLRAKAEVPAAVARFVTLSDVEVEERLLIDRPRGIIEIRTRNLSGNEYVAEHTVRGFFVCGSTLDFAAFPAFLNRYLDLESHFVWRRVGDHLEFEAGGALPWWSYSRWCDDGCSGLDAFCLCVGDMVLHRWWVRSVSAIIVNNFVKADMDNRATLARRTDAYLNNKKKTD